MVVIPTTEVLDVRHTPLDELLEIGPGDIRTAALQEFIDDADNDGNVLLKTNNKKTLIANLDGREYTFPPKGKRVNRRAAINLLLDYGRNGKYFGVDQATGMRRSQWLMMSEKQREPYRHMEPEFKFIDSYLTHAVDTFEDDEDVTEDDVPTSTTTE